MAEIHLFTVGCNQTGTKCAVNVCGEVGKQERKVSHRKVPSISCLLTSHIWPCVSRTQQHSTPSLPHQSWVPRLFLTWRTKHRQKMWFETCFYGEKAKNTRNLTLHISASDDLNCDKIQKKSKRLRISFIFASTREEEMIGKIHDVICFLESCGLATSSQKGHSEQTYIYSTCTFPPWVILLRRKQLFHSHVHTAFGVDV